MFEKSATDLIRGLRQHKYSKEYIQKSLQEINQEIVSQDTRMNAIQKLLVLHLLGIDLSQYAFHIIQSMSLKHEKKTGYLAASISFVNTPVLIMATNLIKKDLKSNDNQESLMALHTLAQIVTHDLARDLHQDVILLLNNSNPFIRKRALLVLYRMFLKYPDCLVEAFQRLRERLEDDDPSVVSCCVTVICELGRMNPKAYLPLAPQLFSLFVGSANNWTLIKMVKLFAALTPLEPRLIRKILGPLKKIIQNTRAMSVLYECIYTVITGGLLDKSVGDDEIATLCIEKLQLFLEQKDQNLKYLGLFALSKLVPVRPEIVSQNRQMILLCLEDGDLSIRIRALELVAGLINSKTLFGTVKRLLVTLANSESGVFTPEEINYRTMVAKHIIEACSKDMYTNLTNFEWYLQVLLDLSKFPGVKVANEIRDQILDVCLRVREVRAFAVNASIPLLNDSKIMNTINEEISMCEVLVAAGWICGEFGEFDDQQCLDIISFLLSPKVLQMPVSVQSAYLFAFFKLFIRSNVDLDYTSQLEKFVASTHLEIQDRTTMISEILHSLNPKTSDDKNPWITKDGLTKEALRGMVSQEFNPVSEAAQKKVTLECPLVLENWLEPLHLSGFDLVTTSIYEMSQKVNLETLDTQSFYLESSSSPSKSARIDYDHLQLSPQRPSLDEPIAVAGKTLDRFSSVLNRPEAKKYALKLNEDEQEARKDSSPVVEHFPQTVDGESVPKKKKKEKKDKKKSKKPKDSLLDTLNFGKYVVWHSDELSVDFSLKEQPNNILEALEVDIEAFLVVNLPSKPRTQFKLVSVEAGTVVKNYKDHALFKVKLKRDSQTDWFVKAITLSILVSEQTYEIQFTMPFAVNVLLPTHLQVASMTPQKFMDILQNPPQGPFTAVGTTSLLPPPGLSISLCIEKISSQMSCIIVERHPGVVSLFGETCTGVAIFGLLKEKRNKAGRPCLALDIKTGHTTVLDWIMETLSTLSSDWLES